MDLVFWNSRNILKKKGSCIVTLNKPFSVKERNTNLFLFNILGTRKWNWKYRQILALAESK